MNPILSEAVAKEEVRGYQKWGGVDTSPVILLNAAVEELGEVAHAINHNEGPENVVQEIAETIGILSRLFDMIWVAGDNKEATSGNH